MKKSQMLALAGSILFLLLMLLGIFVLGSTYFEGLGAGVTIVVFIILLIPLIIADIGVFFVKNERTATILYVVAGILMLLLGLTNFIVWIAAILLFVAAYFSFKLE